MSNEAHDAAGRVIEEFAPSVGRYLGYFGIAYGLVVAVVAAADGFPDHWRVVAFGAAVCTMSWVVLVRPAVALHEHGVLLRNMLRDSFIPSSSIENVKSAQTLMIRTDQETFHGLGVSRSARSMMRERRVSRRNAMSAFGGLSGPVGRDATAEPVHRFANEEQTGGTYQDHVETRIERAGRDAKPDGRRPVVVWSWPAVVAVAISVVCLVMLFV